MNSATFLKARKNALGFFISFLADRVNGFDRLNAQTMKANSPTLSIR